MSRARPRSSQGEFLEGFVIPGASEFENWLVRRAPPLDGTRRLDPDSALGVGGSGRTRGACCRALRARPRPRSARGTGPGRAVARAGVVGRAKCGAGTLRPVLSPDAGTAGCRSFREHSRAGPSGSAMTDPGPRDRRRSPPRLWSAGAYRSSAATVSSLSCSRPGARPSPSASLAPGCCSRIRAWGGRDWRKSSRCECDSTVASWRTRGRCQAIALRRRADSWHSRKASFFTPAASRQRRRTRSRALAARSPLWADRFGGRPAGGAEIPAVTAALLAVFRAVAEDSPSWSGSTTRISSTRRASDASSG